MPDRNLTLPLYWPLRLRTNCCILLMPFLHCHVHLWGGKKEGGKGRALGGGGERDVNEIWWWIMMRLLCTFLHEGILGAQGWYSYELQLLLLLFTCLLLNRRVSEILRQNFAIFRKGLRAEKWETWNERKMKKQKTKNKLTGKMIREISRERRSNKFNLSEAD